MVDDHRRRRRTPVVLPFEPDLDVREESSAEDEVMERVSPEEVQSLLSVLPDDQREVLTLRLIAGLTLSRRRRLRARAEAP
ncbi:MAG: polymerase subunit sigma-70 [Pseudarthrobacter sp.]|nr:polymerase subunit sigma-70 [Pseudarthrobacter sp.]